jgi:hypothetical protein
MPLQLNHIHYADLNDRQKENYNFAQLASLLARYGYACMRLSDDHNGADLIARHADGSHVDIQLKGRFTVDKRYLGKGLYVAFPHDDTFYVLDHDLIVSQLEHAGIYLDTASWRDGGNYSVNKLSNKDVLAMLEPYKL